MPNVVLEFIVSDPDKCNGCGICELACSGFKEKRYNIKRSRIRVVQLGLLVNMAVACRLCEDPPCVRSCPRDALRRDEMTGVIIVDEDKCNGCGWCLEACEFGAIVFHPIKKVVTACDLCDGEPKCVEACPKEALALMTRDALATRLRSASVLRLLEEEMETKKPS